MAGNFPSSAKDPSARTGYILVKLLKTKDKGKHLFLSEKKKKLEGCVIPTLKGNSLNRKEMMKEEALEYQEERKHTVSKIWLNTITFPSHVLFSVSFDR